MPDDDETADKYLLADEKFAAAGFNWYELSNWSKSGSECKHNIAYWNGDNWWGAGAGAHSHLNGRRFWNVKHPAAYAQKVTESKNPMFEEEFLNAQEKHSEEIMLKIRLATGLDRTTLTAHENEAIEGFVSEGYLQAEQWNNGSVVLSKTGRLIADRIVREILL